ncbi:hypothetical protein D3C86_1786690 [compost metagenome]
MQPNPKADTSRRCFPLPKALFSDERFILLLSLWFSFSDERLHPTSPKEEVANKLVPINAPFFKKSLRLFCSISFKFILYYLKNPKSRFKLQRIHVLALIQKSAQICSVLGYELLFNLPLLQITCFKTPIRNTTGSSIA